MNFAGAELAASGESRATLLPKPPVLDAVPVDVDKILLKWSASPEASKHRLQHRVPGGSFADLPIGSATSSFMHESLSPGSQNEYRVFAIVVNGFDENTQQDVPSAASNIVSARPLAFKTALTSAELQWKQGFIELKVKGDATHSIWPDFDNIVTTQRLTLALGFDNKTGEPYVSIGALDNPPDLTIENLDNDDARADARSQFIALRNKILKPEPPGLPPEKALNDKLRDASRRLNETLKKVDIFGSAKYTAIEVNPDGVTVRGSIETSHHYQPQLTIGYTEDGNSFSALDCWIPGGRITNHTWYWVEDLVFKTSDGAAWTIPWFGQQKSSGPLPHHFTLPIPDAIKGRPSWSKSVCLAVDGYQVDRDGRVAQVSGFEKAGTCEVTSHEPILVVDPVWEATYGILWGPTPQPDGILEDRISAHINVLAHPRPASGLGQNALVHFMGARDAGPLPALGRALAGIRRPNVSMTVFLVMPVGAFRVDRRALEETLGLRGEPSSERDTPRQRLFVTEDYGGGWTRTFDARTTPASYLMNARGEFVWKQEGRVDPEALTSAMDEHFLPAPAPQGLSLRLSVRPGEPAPDPATGSGGHVLGLGRLRGEEVLLTFWQSWSAPCLHELRRLQRLHEEGRGRGPAILAVNGGEEPSVLDEVRPCTSSR